MLNINQKSPHLITKKINNCLSLTCKIDNQTPGNQDIRNLYFVIHDLKTFLFEK